MERTDALQKQQGLNVVLMWECEWASSEPSSASVQAFMATYKQHKRLDPTKALWPAYRCYEVVPQGLR